MWVNFVKVWGWQGGKEKLGALETLSWGVCFNLVFKVFWIKAPIDETALRRANNQLSKVQRDVKWWDQENKCRVCLRSRGLDVQIL